MRGYYGYGPYSYGYSPYYIGQQPTVTPPAGHVAQEDGWPSGTTPPGPPPARTMSYQDAYRYLVTCVKNLDAAGVPNEEILTLLIYFGVMEAAAHSGWSDRKIQDMVRGLLAARQRGEAGLATPR